MLKLTLLPEDYLTIGGDIVVQLMRAGGGKADVAIQAPREVPVLRGAVLERQGGQRPACLEPPAKRKPHAHRDQVFYWNVDRERAVRRMRNIFDQIERAGAPEAAQALRVQLERIIPAYWETDLAAQ